MKKGQGNGNGLTWSDIREISRETKSLNTLLPDTGRCTKTQLGHIDFELLISRMRYLNRANREKHDRASSGEYPFSSPYFSE